MANLSCDYTLTNEAGDQRNEVGGPFWIASQLVHGAKFLSPQTLPDLPQLPNLLVLLLDGFWDSLPQQLRMIPGRQKKMAENNGEKN